MTITTFQPELNKIYAFDTYSLLFFDQGQGLFEVDFKTYDFSENKTVFLSPDQYFKLLAGNYTITMIELHEEKVGATINSRFLFKHLVSLGYIEFSNFQKWLTNKETPLLAQAIRDWIKLNPFKTSPEETDLLFDLKEIVDTHYKTPLSIDFVARKLKEKPYRIEKLTKEKLERTVNRFSKDRLILEANRKIAFTDWTTKEIAYELGFSAPTYFNRFYKNNIGKTPYEFREDYLVGQSDTFVNDLVNLINQHYHTHHNAAFYADQLHLSVKTLFKKLKNKTDKTYHELLREKIIQESKNLLKKNIPVNTIAFELGFKEAHHFSNFFKNYSGITPSAYLHS